MRHRGRPAPSVKLAAVMEEVERFGRESYATALGRLDRLERVPP